MLLNLLQYTGQSQTHSFDPEVLIEKPYSKVVQQAWELLAKISSTKGNDLLLGPDVENIIIWQLLKFCTSS